MLNYILRRILLMVPTVIGITMVVFLTMYLSPGGVGGSLLNESGQMRPDERMARQQYLEKRFGLNKPFLVQYGRWLNQSMPIGFKDAGQGWPRSIGFGLKKPDLGRSFTRERPVVDMVVDALPITLALNLLSTPLVYCVAMTTGILTAARKGSAFDVGIGVLLIALWSLPSMWIGVMMIGFLANRDYMPGGHGLIPTAGLNGPLAGGWPFFPSISEHNPGWLLDRIWHLAAPVVCMSYGGAAFQSKLTRGSILENLASDFVRTARAKGQSERVILYRHVLRNSILPLITLSAGLLPGLLGGSAIIENIFSINGMGKMMLEAIQVRDREVVLSITLVVAIIGTASLLIADVCYVIADPRVSYE